MRPPPCASARTCGSNPGAKSQRDFDQLYRGARIDLATLDRLASPSDCPSSCTIVARLEPAVRTRALNRNGTSTNFIGAPGFEPGTSASRTQRSTGLSHAPVLRTTHFNWWVNDPLCDLLRGSRGFEAHLQLLDESIHGRGGIRTHEGVNPHDFQSCALSHSATRPKSGPRSNSAA